MSDVGCRMYDVRCTMYDVRSTMYDVRCTMYDGNLINEGKNINSKLIADSL
jgi:hypothetical protein